ncbi:hypothetical protein AIOL_003737 [Candidatus Rhodobacter oscarellae]|uniref:Uncharacterized protein n=1 Tax=Candidatus Rhodobacter oscarellae TaxID=1675527 RepID=A0A0J9E7Q4_9RHOB|nr:hypothetical protein [Candidatus Rhodobacter lobularis]KMW58757.1 hypothetical protein AIOL_003737 [Candidatus Rhodobacter lobularis]
MFVHRDLTKPQFLERNKSELQALFDRVNADLAARYGAALQPLTPHDFWLVFFAEAAIDARGHVDINGRHSLGERGLLPLPSNITFWNGPGAPNPTQPHSLTENLTHYALYLGQLKNKVVRQRGGRDIYPGLFRHPGIAGNRGRMAKVLAGVVHGYFFGGNYRPGPPPDNALLDGFARDRSVADMLRGTTYVHAGTSILENRQRNIDEAMAFIERHFPHSGPGTGGIVPANADGRYTLASGATSGFATAILRIDVDGPQAQGHLSLEVTQGFPRLLTHVVAEVVDDGQQNGGRRIQAVPIYQSGDDWLVRGDEITLVLPASGDVNVVVRRGSAVISEFDVTHEGPYFDKVEFEVDVVENAGRVHEIYDPHSHPNRPATLPAAAVTIERAFREAGFDVQMSAERSSIPLEDAGSNETWSNSELHNAMQRFWSRYDDQAQWGLWVIYAAMHDRGDDLGGIMFDNIGSNHRQGTAIFTDSFISRPPFGETHPDAWRRRMQIWTAVHEIGHGFNMAHSWEKALGDAFPLTAKNEPEARSFMNYPYGVSGGQEAFFSDFEFRFSDRELLFLRHAPRDFVRMGGARWGSNHGLEAPPDMTEQHFQLELRPNRDRNVFPFMEPVHLELKLTNTSTEPRKVPSDILTDGHHLAIAVARDGAEKTRRHRPFVMACQSLQTTEVAAGKSLYATHFVAASTGGWLIDEPGFYSVQAAVSIEGEMLISNVLRIYVSPGSHMQAHTIAPDFFNEDVGRVLAFQGVPELSKANDVLQEVIETMPDAAVAQHARLGVAGPYMRRFKRLIIGDDRADLRVQASAPDLDRVLELQRSMFGERATETAETLGHIQYRASAESLAQSLADNGALDEAAAVQNQLVDTLERREILPSVIRDCRAILGVYRGAQKNG